MCTQRVALPWNSSWRIAVNPQTNFITATGTAEVGGWTTRELLSILDGLEGVEVVGADVGKCSEVQMSAAKG